MGGEEYGICGRKRAEGLRALRFRERYLPEGAKCQRAPSARGRQVPEGAKCQRALSARERRPGGDLRSKIKDFSRRIGRTFVRRIAWHDVSEREEMRGRRLETQREKTPPRLLPSGGAHSPAQPSDFRPQPTVGVRARRRFAQRIASAIGCAIVLNVFTPAGSPAHAQLGRLSPNDKAYLVPGYVGLARDLGDPGPCRLIADTSVWKASMGARGHQIGYWKSTCFFELAVATRDTSWCAQVRPKRTWLLSIFLDGSEENRRNCVDAVRSSSPKANVAWAGEIPVLRALGCRADDVVRGLRMDPSWRGRQEMDVMAGPWITFYFGLIRSGDLRRHIRDLPDFSRNGYQKMADPAWCAQVDTLAVSETGGSRIVGHVGTPETGGRVPTAVLTLERVGDSTFHYSPPVAADGSFLIRGLQSGHYRIRTRAVGYKPLTSEVDIPAAPVELLLDLPMIRESPR